MLFYASLFDMSQDNDYIQITLGQGWRTNGMRHNILVKINDGKSMATNLGKMAC